MEPLTDKTLFVKTKKGDEAAFRQLFQNYFNRLFIFACKFVEEDAAKDLIQDCFLELWKNRRNTEITSSFSSWIFTVVKNRCYRYLKDESRKIENQNNYRLRLKEEELNFFINSESSILEFEVEERIRRVIEQLPPKCSQVFRESRYHGLSNRDIAEKMNITLKAVEKHITKALSMFREEFKELIPILFALSVQFVL